jgi:hypothetical protein
VRDTSVGEAELNGRVLSAVGGSSVRDTSVGGAELNRRVPSAVGGSSVRDTLVGGAELNGRVPSAVAGARTPLCTPVVAGACISSMCVSVDVGGAVCKSESEAWVCVIDASGAPVGIPGLSSSLSSVSSPLQMVSA